MPEWWTTMDTVLVVFAVGGLLFVLFHSMLKDTRR